MELWQQTASKAQGLKKQKKQKHKMKDRSSSSSERDPFGPSEFHKSKKDPKVMELHQRPSVSHGRDIKPLVAIRHNMDDVIEFEGALHYLFKATTTVKDQLQGYVHFEELVKLCDGDVLT